MKKIQIIYFIIFFITGIGIVGNMELGVPIPLYGKILFTISSILVAGKFIYWGMKGELM